MYLYHYVTYHTTENKTDVKNKLILYIKYRHVTGIKTQITTRDFL